MSLIGRVQWISLSLRVALTQREGLVIDMTITLRVEFKLSKCILRYTLVAVYTGTYSVVFTMI